MEKDRFEDQGEIGRGGMGVVHKVFDREMLRHVALKEADPALDPELLARFVEEAQIMGQLEHANIVPVHDIERDARGRPVRFIMKLIDGRTLEEIVEAEKEAPLSGERLEEALRIFLKVCDAVSFAHSRGVIHQDLNPRNVMVGSHGQVYVMDWGLAVLRGRSATRSVTTHRVPDRFDLSGSLGGTLAFMAPEQAYGRTSAVDERTDVFGLGGILYHFLTLRPPYAGNVVDDVLALAKAGRVPPPADVVRERQLPAGLCRIAMKALAAEPADRYQTVDEVRVEVEAFLRGGGWFQTVTFPRGTLILREGERGEVAYIITEGRCEIYRVAGGAKVPLRRVGPGEVFGEVGLVTPSPRTATVEATTDVTALLVTRSALEQEVRRNGWMRALIEAAVERFVEVDRPPA
ncbi:MAG TPA: protein kinase [Candidatus Binatus sp.]|nr:protein kinase [Candidatus Binatus sp.]